MEGYRILLACVSGMSTSLMVRNMRKEAAMRDVNIEIYFASELDIVEKATSMDIVLLGPQLRTSRKKFEKKLSAYHVCVVAIPIPFFSEMDGEKVLDFAIANIEEERMK